MSSRARALKSERAGEAGAGLTAAAYAHFAPFVRSRLGELGVREADLGDLCHEVFLIVHDKAEAVSSVERIDLWLRAVCRRVAAGYRRRSGHKLEILGRDLEAEWQDADPDGTGGGAERRRQLELLRRALGQLDVESRDLLALHDVGEMPLAELARLVAHDRKTVRKRLVTARRRVSRLVAEDAAPAARAAAAAAMGDKGAAGQAAAAPQPALELPAARGRAHGCMADGLEVVYVSPGRNVGVIGNVAIATWGREVTREMVDSIFDVAPRTIERCGGELVYLAVIEPTFGPPSLEARQRIVDALEVCGPYLSAFAIVLLGKMSSLTQPILSGMMLLARPRFPMQFFDGVAPAARWLCDGYARGPGGPLAAAELADAADRLRAVRTEIA